MFCCVAASGPEQTPADGAEGAEATADNPEDPRSHTNTLTHIHTNWHCPDGLQSIDAVT